MRLCSRAQMASSVPTSDPPLSIARPQLPQARPPPKRGERSIRTLPIACPAASVTAGDASCSAATRCRCSPTVLANEVARAVVDRTGLAGNWDFELTYTRDAVRRPDVTDASPANIDPDGASLFTALQEQLGLKLDSTKGPVRVLVIERIEQ